MQKKQNNITVFEHQSIFTNRGFNLLPKDVFNSLVKFHGDSCDYFSLLHQGVKFNEYVGVIQIGNFTIEVLPKADKNNDKEKWRKLLIKMLQRVGIFNVKAPSFSDLSLRSNSILDLYFKLYVDELEYLLHRGLIRKYRKKEGNLNALKGRLSFSKHISKNFIHKEKFYVEYSNYDKDHLIHQILFKALKLLQRINREASLNSRINSILIDFPEVRDIKVTESLFDRISYDRKSEIYSNALKIAELILLNYHPDIKSGRHDVLALMFDMNMLWERYVYVILRKEYGKDYAVKGQCKKDFWKPINGYKTTLRPDIVVTTPENKKIIIDTKWKILKDLKPSSSDLQQLFAYSQYFNSEELYLLYPGDTFNNYSGEYFDFGSKKVRCNLIKSPIEELNMVTELSGLRDELINEA